MIAGGFDDFSEEGSYEFANMGATSNSHTEFAMGREPNEMSRPTTSTRDGVSLFIADIDNSIIDALLVHGSSRLRRPSCHERKDCHRARGDHSGHCCVHVHIHVSTPIR